MPASKDPRKFNPAIIAAADACEQGRSPITLEFETNARARHFRTLFYYYSTALKHEIARLRTEIRVTKTADPDWQRLSHNNNLLIQSLNIRLSSLTQYTTQLHDRTLTIIKYNELPQTRSLLSQLSSQLSVEPLPSDAPFALASIRPQAQIRDNDATDSFIRGDTHAAQPSPDDSDLCERCYRHVNDPIHTTIERS